MLVHFNTRKNPLKTDPTRTSLIRRKMVAELRKRFRRLKAAIRDFIDSKDALGLKEKELGLATLAREREFAFRTDPQKLEAFNAWLKEQIEAEILSVPPGTSSVTGQFIESAFKKGQLNAYLSSKEAAMLEEAFGQQTQEAFLRSAFGQPETLSKVQLLATRSFEDLKGVTTTMASQMNQILAQGMIEGKGAAEIAAEMVERIDSLVETRAITIARTEIVAAHSEGQLDAFEKLGVEELGVKVEWSTAQDDRVCPECEQMEGKVFTIDEARGLIPLHPNCRCAWIPAPPSNE